ncbi:MAG: ATP-binding protein [Clostridia bacterium]|nr:ATP-binding protein [Clostridia bacterium]
MKIIKRENYLNELIGLTGTPDIKVITGVRRSGKSILLQQYAEYLKKTEEKINIVSVNLQELEYDFLLDYHRLHEFIMDNYKSDCRNVVMIDEIQLCEKFELAINSLHAKQKFDIFLTGSNAFLLSSDLATLFTGRVMEIKVYPFSFSEYIEYFGIKNNIPEAFDEYVRMGGMSGSYFYDSEVKRFKYVEDVYKTVLERDLVQKYKIRNKSEFFSISEFMMDNIGNLLSPNNVCDTLNRAESEITRKTVDKYIKYLENAFLFYEAKRYDLKGKKYLETNKKYYLCDPAFRYAVNGTKNLDFGRMYENIVFMELLRRGYEVYVGKLYKKEIDFVAIKRNERIYIPVSDNIADAKTLDREVRPLLQIKDAYPKMVIARTRHEDYQNEGVLITDLSNWLLEHHVNG